MTLLGNPTLHRKGIHGEKKTPLKQARLDYFLITENLLSSVNKSRVDEKYRSNHSVITLDISFVKFKKGKPLWKDNNFLLHDEDYLPIINNKISEIKNNTQYLFIKWKILI